MSDLYTLDQKAAAFDALWDRCGSQQGTLHDFKSVNISRPDTPPSQAYIKRVPRYTYTMIAEDLPTFRNVLHYLATRGENG